MNTENINRMIKALRADEGRRLKMARWMGDPNNPEADVVTEYNECGTTACLAGWVNVLRQTDAGVKAKDVDTHPDWDDYEWNRQGQRYLDIEQIEADRLFYMGGRDNRNQFDALPPEQRAAAAIRVLEGLRDTGVVDWDKALSAS